MTHMLRLGATNLGGKLAIGLLLKAGLSWLQISAVMLGYVLFRSGRNLTQGLRESHVESQEDQWARLRAQDAREVERKLTGE